MSYKIGRRTNAFGIEWPWGRNEIIERLKALGYVG